MKAAFDRLGIQASHTMQAPLQRRWSITKPWSTVDGDGTNSSLINHHVLSLAPLRHGVEREKKNNRKRKQEREEAVLDRIPDINPPDRVHSTTSRIYGRHVVHIIPWGKTSSYSSFMLRQWTDLTQISNQGYVLPTSSQEKTRNALSIVGINMSWVRSIFARRRGFAPSRESTLSLVVVAEE